MQERPENEKDDLDFLPTEDDPEDFEYEEIVEGDDPETEDGFNPEEYTEVDLGDFDTWNRRQLKKIKVKYRATRSTYTKTT